MSVLKFTPMELPGQADQATTGLHGFRVDRPRDLAPGIAGFDRVDGAEAPIWLAESSITTKL